MRPPSKQPVGVSIRIARLRHIAFWVSIVLTSLFLLAALLPAYPLIIINWLPTDLWLAVRPDRAEGDEAHRLHSLALAVIAWGMLLGVVWQGHRPSRKISPLLASLAVPIAIAVSEALAGTYTLSGTAPFFLLIFLVIALHPSVGDFVRLPGWNLPMLGLNALAAFPWVIYAARMGETARTTGTGGEVDHLTFMSALALLTVLWGIIGATRHTGWPYAAAGSLVATAAVGLQSVLFTNVLSAISLPWAAAALLWCVAYGSLAILRLRSERPAS